MPWIAMAGVIFIAMLLDGAPVTDEETFPAELHVEAVFFFFRGLEDVRTLLEGAEGTEGESAGRL